MLSPAHLSGVWHLGTSQAAREANEFIKAMGQGIGLPEPLCAEPPVHGSRSKTIAKPHLTMPPGRAKHVPRP